MFENIRRFIERGRKGYCYSDLWQFDNWLSKLIAGGLKEFRANVHSYPSEVITFEKWLGVLDEMIECFEEQTRNIDNLPDKNFIKLWKERRAYQRRKLHRGLQLLERYYYDLWD